MERRCTAASRAKSRFLYTRIRSALEAGRLRYDGGYAKKISADGGVEGHAHAERRVRSHCPCRSQLTGCRKQPVSSPARQLLHPVKNNLTNCTL